VLADFVLAASRSILTSKARRTPPLRKTLPRLTDRVALGDGLLVSPICVGAVSRPEVVLAAWEAGAEKEIFPGVKAGRRTRLYNFKTIDGWVTPEKLDALGLDPRSWKPHPVDHYRFALSQPALDGVLAAFSHPREVRQLADALAFGPMPEEQQRYLKKLAQAKRSVEEQP